MAYITWAGDNQNYVYQGKNSLQLFHNEMAMRYPDVYKLTFQQLVDYVQLQELNPLDYIFGDETSPLHELGKSIITQKIDDAKINDAFKELAKKLEGKLPPKNRMLNALLSALSGQLGKFDFNVIGDASIEVIKDAKNFVFDTSSDIYQGAYSIFDESLEVAGSALNTVKDIGKKGLDITTGALDSVSSLAKNAKWIIPVLAGVAVVIIAKGYAKK